MASNASADEDQDILHADEDQDILHADEQVNESSDDDSFSIYSVFGYIVLFLGLWSLYICYKGANEPAFTTKNPSEKIMRQPKMNDH